MVLHSPMTNNIKIKIPILLFLMLSILSCGQDLPSYFTQHDLNQPIAFANNEILTSNGINFTKDGRKLYTSNQMTKQFDNGRFYAGIFESRYENGQWTKPKRVQFNFDIDAYHPILSIDNEVLFFNSRSHLDSLNKSTKHDIWSAHKPSNGWSTPKPVKGINSLATDSYPSIARNNNLYFNSDRKGGMGGMDIYVSYFVNGQYQQPINLAILNSDDVENDLVIDPEERFIIFNRYIDSTKAIDLFISFKRNNKWTTPRKLDNINTSDNLELTPTLSPDGKYFFYELNRNIMQIDLAAVIFTDELPEIGRRKKDTIINNNN